MEGEITTYRCSGFSLHKDTRLRGTWGGIQHTLYLSSQVGAFLQAHVCLQRHLSLIRMEDFCGLGTAQLKTEQDEYCISMRVHCRKPETTRMCAYRTRVEESTAQQDNEKAWSTNKNEVDLGDVRKNTK